MDLDTATLTATSSLRHISTYTEKDMETGGRFQYRLNCSLT